MMKINLGKRKVRKASKEAGLEVTIPATASKILGIKAGDHLTVILDIDSKQIIYYKEE